jgi:hypothetical protein
MSNLTQILLAQEMPQESSPIAGLFGLVIAVLLIASLWKTFTKAGKPGWGAIIPIYNVILLLQIAGRPIWWIVLMIIPVVNFVVAIIVSIDVAKNFGKGTGFGVGLALLGFIFYPIIAFGDAQYQPQSQG